MTDQAAPTRRTYPATLRWAVALLALQTLGVAAGAAWLGYEDLTAAPGGSASTGVAVTVYFAIVAVILGVLTWFLHRRRAWARGPLVAMELLLAGVGTIMIRGGLPQVGIPAIAVGLACVVLLLTAPTREALGIR